MLWKANRWHATAQSRIATEEKVSASVLVTPSNKLLR
jgi:hypothetical protein